MPELRRQTRVEVSAQALDAWHRCPGAFDRLVPPWQDVRVRERPAHLGGGERLVMDIHGGPASVRWVAEHEDLDDGLGFRDTQVQGPFGRWIHTHRFVEAGAEHSLLRDHVDYELPFQRLSLGLAGRVAGGPVRTQLERMFDFRHERTRHDLERQSAFDMPASRIVVSGATGLLGTATCAFLSCGDHQIDRLVRAGTDRSEAPLHGSRGIEWDPGAGQIDDAALEGADAVVHLAGENVIGIRWTDEKKRAIRESRVQGTRTLCEALARLENPPRVVVSASAVGYYGDRDDPVDESADPGSDFLAEVCRDWEAATAPAAEAGIRVVHLRLGVVLSASGGALALAAPIFRAGLGGRIGDGATPFPWVARDDAIYILARALADDSLEGPVNVVAPATATIGDFSAAMGSVLSRPTALRIPEFPVRTALGEMATEVLSGAPVVPTKLRRAGYIHAFPDLEAALRFELGA
ncbi:MAG: TIGR01777 family oxidoreductase [Solirubrobacterales bacterium]